MKIYTNRIVYELDTIQMASLYDVYSLKTTDVQFPSGAKTIDELSNNKSIASIMFVSRKEYLIMLKKGAENKNDLLDNVRKLKSGDKITLTDYFSGKTNNYYLLQLLLNAIGTRQTKFESYNNVTGHLYCFHPNWIKRSHSEIISIPTMDIRLASGILTWNICTFNSLKYKNVMDFGKRNISEFPQYTISANYSLRRKLKEDENLDAFIQRKIFNEKTSKTFLDISDEKAFDESKMGIITKVISQFNEKYNGLAKLDFEPQELNPSSIEYSSSREKRLLSKRIIELLSKQKVVLIDLIGNVKSASQCEIINSVFKTTFGISVKQVQKLSKDAYNLRLIHNDEYYGKNIADPHDDDLSKYTVQHITTDNFNDKGSNAYLRAVAFNVAEELAIKEDLKNKTISIVDWKEYDFKDNLVFGLEHDVQSPNGNKIRQFYFMTIKPNGQFEIQQQENNLFSTNEYHKYLKIFTSCVEETVKGIVKYNENINVIHETGLHTVPNIFGLKEELAKGNNKLKNKDARDNYLSALLDVKTFTKDNELYYYVGEMGVGINSTLSGVPIRKIETYNNSLLFFDKLLKLMGVTFVRNGQLTVVPFPFKYLREYINSLREEKK
ncbi:MAG: hypothetical protein UH850_03780 [Paludibacteraceae bacterium]|nr:hypothetical protein [Paludibacteraceae bacterium]